MHCCRSVTVCKNLKNLILWGAVMLVFGLGPWRSWRAPQMRSPVQPRPSCHAPHSGYGHRGLVVVTENSGWVGKNSRCQIGHESLIFMAAVVILLTGQRYRPRQDWVLATHWQRLHLDIFIGFKTSTMIVEGSRNVRIEVWASRFPHLDGNHGQCGRMQCMWIGHSHKQPWEWHRLKTSVWPRHSCSWFRMCQWWVRGKKLS